MLLVIQLTELVHYGSKVAFVKCNDENADFKQEFFTYMLL